MKTIKRNTTEEVTIKSRFTVGAPITWVATSFDGRVHHETRLTGTVVKINKVTVDVEMPNKDVVRLDAWDLATANR